jgi:hypothetical protein
MKTNKFIHLKIAYSRKISDKHIGWISYYLIDAFGSRFPQHSISLEWYKGEKTEIFSDDEANRAAILAHYSEILANLESTVTKRIRH